MLKHSPLALLQDKPGKYSPAAVISGESATAKGGQNWILHD